MSWEEYFKKFESAPPRPLLVETLKRIEFKPDMRAIDLGCGAGVDTLHLLKNDWTVTAVEREASGIETLKKGMSDDFHSRLSILKSSFEELSVLPESHLVYASFSIPFCKPDKFEQFWKVIDKAILKNGYFAGNFFGPDDEWVKGGLTGIDEISLRALFKEFKIIEWHEKNEMGPTALGPNKHWHIFTVIAVKR